MSMHQRLKEKMREQLSSLYGADGSAEKKPRDRKRSEISASQTTEKAQPHADQQEEGLTNHPKLAQTFGERNSRGGGWDQFSFASRDSHLRENPELIDSVLNYNSANGEHIMNTSDHDSQGEFTPREVRTSTKKERDHIEIYNLDYESVKDDRREQAILLIGEQFDSDLGARSGSKLKEEVQDNRIFSAEKQDARSNISRSPNQYELRNSRKAESKPQTQQNSPAKHSDTIASPSKISKGSKSPALAYSPTPRSPQPQTSGSRLGTTQKHSNTTEKQPQTRPMTSKQPKHSIQPKTASRASTAEKENSKSHVLSVNSMSNHEQSVFSKTDAYIRPSTSQLKELEKLHNQSSEHFKRLGGMYQQLIDHYTPWTPTSPDSSTLAEMRDVAQRYSTLMSKLKTGLHKLQAKQSELDTFL